MFKDTIGSKVKKVLALRVKNGEKEYRECKDANHKECESVIEEARKKEQSDNMDAADTIVKKILGG